MDNLAPAKTVSETSYKGYDIRTDRSGRVWIYHQSYIVAGPVTGSHAKSLIDDYTAAA
jgi:hypothetical protein